MPSTKLYKQSRAGRLAKQANQSKPSRQSYRASKPANQPTNQPTNKPTNQSTDQATNQSTKQATNQPISRPTNHGADLANYFQNKRLRPPLPRKSGRSYCRLRSLPTTVQKFIVIVRKDGSLLGVSNQLKIGDD